jgi:hypothetical protein
LTTAVSFDAFAEIGCLDAVRKALWVLNGSGHITGLIENWMAMFNERREVGVLFVKVLCARPDIILLNETTVHTGDSA